MPVLSENIITIIYACFIPFCGLLFLLFLIPINHLFSKTQNRLFMFAVVLNGCMMLLTVLDFGLSTAQFADAWIFRRITSFFNFAFAPIIPLILFRIFKQRKTSFLIYIPFLINVVICFISIFTNLVFFIGVDNSYGRGPLFFIPFLIALIYIGVIAWYPADVHWQSQREERILILSIMAALSLSMLFEICFQFHCLNYGVCAMGLCVFYLMQNIHYFTTDPLTGAYNRQMYQHMLSKITNSRSCVFALLDINDFKEINDTYGHKEGDEVLIEFVEILNQNMNRIANLYRIGGDEFILIAPKAGKNVLHSAIFRAQKEVGLKNITFAFGIGEYHPSEDIQEFLRIVDREMYQNKASMKSLGGADESNK